LFIRRFTSPLFHSRQAELERISTGLALLTSFDLDDEGDDAALARIIDGMFDPEQASDADRPRPDPCSVRLLPGDEKMLSPRQARIFLPQTRIANAESATESATSQSMICFLSFSFLWFSILPFLNSHI
jgi:hypothetical protein